MTWDTTRQTHNVHVSQHVCGYLYACSECFLVKYITYVTCLSPIPVQAFISPSLVVFFSITLFSEAANLLGEKERGGRERERERERESASFSIGVTAEPQSEFGVYLSIDVLLLRFHCNFHPRSRHVEPDAQVTHRALCLLHNAPAHLKGINKE